MAIAEITIHQLEEVVDGVLQDHLPDLLAGYEAMYIDLRTRAQALGIKTVNHEGAYVIPEWMVLDAIVSTILSDMFKVARAMVSQFPTDGAGIHTLVDGLPI